MTNETTARSKVGWVGLGKMGLPICKRLRDAGFQINALRRSEEKEMLARSHGFTGTRTLAETAVGCKFVASAISDDSALVDIVLGAGGLREVLLDSQIYVDISTVSPEASLRVAEALKPTGCAYLRAPVSGSTATAAQGALTAMVSGPASAFAAATDLFAAFTRKTFHVGGAEEARILKLAINAMVGATSALLAESLALARSGGLGDETVMSVVAESAVASPLLQYKRGMVVSGEYPAAFSVSQILKDFGLITRAAEAASCPMPLIASIREQYRAAELRGLGDRDFFVLTAKRE